MPKKGRWAEHPELLKERSQDGVIRALTLESLGMNSNVIYRRCLPAGPWQRLLPGIILLHNTEPTLRERLIAALLYCGPQALVTGAAARRLYGLRVPTEFPDAEIHVLVPHERKILSSEFVNVERTARIPGAWIREGIPLAPLVRATTDAVRRVRVEEPVGSLLFQAIQRGRCPPDAIK